MNKIFDFLIRNSPIEHKIVYAKIIGYTEKFDINWPVEKFPDKVMYIKESNKGKTYFLNSDIKNTLFANGFGNDIIVINYKFINHTINILQKYIEKD